MDEDERRVWLWRKRSMLRELMHEALSPERYVRQEMAKLDREMAERQAWERLRERWSGETDR